MNTEEQIYTYRLTRKVRAGGSMFLALICFLMGLVFLFAFWPLGLIFIVIAFAVDAKTRTVSLCGHCHNEVAPSSRLCPTCRADLATPSVGQQVKNAFRKVIIAFLTVILLIVVVVLFVRNR